VIKKKKKRLEKKKRERGVERLEKKKASALKFLGPFNSGTLLFYPALATTRKIQWGGKKKREKEGGGKNS